MIYDIVSSQLGCLTGAQAGGRVRGWPGTQKETRDTTHIDA
jgi:hypothetical protein